MLQILKIFKGTLFVVYVHTSSCCLTLRSDPKSMAVKSSGRPWWIGDAGCSPSPSFAVHRISNSSKLYAEERKDIMSPNVGKMLIEKKKCITHKKNIDMCMD